MSAGAAWTVDPSRFHVVGLELNASHLRGVTEGLVTGRARPLHLGRRTQVWICDISDAAGRPVCAARMTAFVTGARQMTAVLVFAGARLESDAVDGLVGRCAESLRLAGLREGDAIAIMLRNDPYFLIALRAARLLGAYAVPVNWHFQAPEAGHILRDSGAWPAVRSRRFVAGHRRRGAADGAGRRASRAVVFGRERTRRLCLGDAACHRAARARDVLGRLARSAGPCPSCPAAAFEHDLHVGHDRPAERGPSRRHDVAARGSRGGGQRRHLRPTRRCPRAGDDTALSQRPQRLRAHRADDLPSCWSSNLDSMPSAPCA